MTLNESFANYSQYLWDEHRYGIDEADYQAMGEEDGYFQSAQSQGYHNLVWFDFDDKEQMFDGHSYNKGGRILHMLRNHLGDEAFFKGISTYLKQNQYKAAEYNHLRLAMEEVSGQDLNWFFNQWYLGSGHPILQVDQTIDEANQVVRYRIEQIQDLEEFPLFILPIKIGVHDSNGKHIEEIMVTKEVETFEIPFKGQLSCAIFDHQEMLLSKTSETKPVNQFIYQYYNGTKFKTRMKGLEDGFEAGSPKSEQMVLDALNDPFWKIRVYAIEYAEKLTAEKKTTAMKLISNLAINDGKSQVRAAAASYLGANSNDEASEALIGKIILEDKSYLVVGSALTGYTKLNPTKALAAAKNYEDEPSSKMQGSVAQVYGVHGTIDQASFFPKALGGEVLSGFDQLTTMNAYTLFNTRMETETIAKAVPVYTELNTTGGYYTKMFISRNIDYLLNNLKERLEELEYDLAKFEENDDAALADQNRKKIASLKKLISDLEAIPTKK